MFNFMTFWLNIDEG